MRPGAALLITSDQEGRNPLALFSESQIKKEMAFESINGERAYMHYPVFPHLTYGFGLNEGEKPGLNVIETPIYKLLDKIEEHNQTRYFVTKPDPERAGTVKVYQWKND